MNENNKSGKPIEVGVKVEFDGFGILLDFVKGLGEIITEEEQNIDKYYFSKEEQQGFIFALKRIRDRVIEELMKIDNERVKTYLLQNDKKSE